MWLLREKKKERHTYKTNINNGNKFSAATTWKEEQLVKVLLLTLFLVNHHSMPMKKEILLGYLARGHSVKRNGFILFPMSLV